METVLITGASRGIGLALTTQFLALNHAVIATYRGAPSPALDALKGDPLLRLLELEVTDENSVAQLGQHLLGVQIDILINNAGIIGAQAQSMDDINPQQWLNTFAVNTIAPLMVSRTVLPHMQNATHPRIVTLSSQMGAINRDNVGMYAYRSSKAAVNKVMKVLSLELKDKGVAVCVIHPGWVKTDMGGDEADITVEESASGIVQVAMALTMSKSGSFLTWQGDEHVW